MSVVCPKCKSEQLTTNKKGYSAAKGVAGAVLTGGIGLLAGLHGSSDIEVSCINCGHTWNPKKVYEANKQKEKKLEVLAANKIKKDFYAAVERGNEDKADEIRRITENMVRFPTNQEAYDYLKKQDKAGNAVMVILVAVVLLIIYWIIN